MKRTGIFKPYVVSLLLALACLSQGIAHAQGLAMVLDRTGDVEVTAAGKTARLNLLDYLPADTELRLPAGAAVTLVYLPSSQEWQFTGPGRYRLQADKPSALQGAAPRARAVPAPASQAMAKLEPAQRERMALGAVVMRGNAALRIVSPNNVDVLNAKPTLLWQAAGGSSVRVTVTPAQSQAISAQTVTSALQWTVPAELPAGDYEWRAEVLSDPNGTSRMGRFRIIDNTDERRKKIGPVPASFPQRVAHAVTLESESLPHDALLLWRALSAERPEEETIRQWAR
ncbi:MAG: hypothetical protein V4451_12835 [Pseudomonadota bacterium]